MKMRHNMVTGIVGLLTCIFFFIMTQQVRQPANLLEPGPRLLPYVAIFLIGISSIALIVKGYKEREIAELVVAGKSSPKIAQELDISVRTVENHRARLMEKLRVDSIAELVRLFL